jgi:hypothetical protein
MNLQQTFSACLFLVIIPLITLWAVITPVKSPPTYNNPYAAYHHRSGQ